MYSYIILTPKFITSSAGIHLLYRLGSDLRAHGFKVYYTNDVEYSQFVEWNEFSEFQIPFSRALAFVRFGKANAIYPEVVYGNPLGSPRVVRYILNVPGVLGVSTRFSDSEKKFLYSRYYERRNAHKIDGYLYKPMIDRELFYNHGNSNQRKKKLYYVGKGVYRPGYIDPTEYIEITRSWPSRAILADLLRASDHIVIFDSSTALAFEAAMCGCATILIPDNKHSEQDLLAYELGNNGVAWGMEDLPRARATLDRLPIVYEQAKIDYEAQLTNFIRITQSEWEVEKKNYPDSLLLRYESLAFENELLKKSLEILLSRKISSGRKPELRKVLIWGTGLGAKRAYPFIADQYIPLGFISNAREIPDWVADLGLPCFPCSQLNQIGVDFSLVIVASQYRQEISKTVNSCEALKDVEIKYLSDYFMS